MVMLFQIGTDHQVKGFKKSSYGARYTLARNGVSETSVMAAAGWSSGAMVARHTRALSGELAVEEFQRSWGG